MTIASELVNILGFRLEGQDSLRKFNSGMDDAEKHSRSAASRLASFGRTAGVAGVAVAGFAAKAVVDFAGFERTMLRVGTTAGASAGEIVNASDEVRRLADRFALPVDAAVQGLDTLTASGQSLNEAMAFLPAVLATAQASGAAVDDVANTALKASSALKIEAGQLQSAFDIMVAGGKAGQFELKDMAQYIPSLSNSFASLGYEGTGGLQKLIALMQTVREDTGDASTAATNLTNIFGKVYSPETANNFKKFGIDLEAQMKKARDSGEDTVAAFVRLSNEAIKGDLSKLPKLFTDQQFREGMQSLMTSADSYQKFLQAVNGTEVNGVVFRDLQRFTNDTTASIQKMSNSWSDFMNAVGGAVAPAVSKALNSATNTIGFSEATTKGARAHGVGAWGQLFSSQEDLDRYAREAGYVSKSDAVALETAKNAPELYKTLGRYPTRPGQQTSGVQPAVAPDEWARSTRRDVPNYAAAISAMPSQPASDSPLVKGILEKVNSLSTALAAMTSSAAVGATISDQRQDNRSTTVQAPVTVNQTINQPSEAPGAVARATGTAAAGAISTAASRLQVEPSF